MSRGRVLVIDPTWQVGWVEEELREADVVVAAAERPDGDDVVGLLVCPEVRVGPDELRRLPRLEVVATNSTGFDHFDLEALSAAGVWCTSAGQYCTEEVAEHAIAMTLDLLRGVTMLDRHARGGAWDLDPAPPRRIAGACLGIVGFGRIGQAVARRAVALGMDVLASDAFVSPEEIAAAGAESVAELRQLLARADVVTLHAPLDETTRGLIDAEALGAMRPGAFLVNCARAGLVDHDALAAALASGHLGGLALDVLPVEPPAADEPAFAWPRTIVNPHAAWYSPATALEPYRRAAHDVMLVLTGREPINPIARPARAPER